MKQAPQIKETAVKIWSKAHMSPVHMHHDCAWLIIIPPGVDTPFNVMAGDLVPWLGYVSHREIRPDGSIHLWVE